LFFFGAFDCMVFCVFLTDAKRGSKDSVKIHDDWFYYCLKTWNCYVYASESISIPSELSLCDSFWTLLKGEKILDLKYIFVDKMREACKPSLNIIRLWRKSLQTSASESQIWKFISN
jgi:hypothetical protein